MQLVANVESICLRWYSHSDSGKNTRRKSFKVTNLDYSNPRLLDGLIYLNVSFRRGGKSSENLYLNTQLTRYVVITYHKSERK